MAFEKSPSLTDYKDGLPEKTPTPPARPKNTRLTLLAVLALVLVLTVANFVKSETGSFLLRKGSVRGMAVDQNGAPFIGDVFIVGVDFIARTASDGYFFLDGIPAGGQSLVVADETSGQVYTITVVPGQTVDIGQVKFLVTATPGQ